MNDSHVSKGSASVPRHADKDTSGPVPMRHRNRLGMTDLQANPQGAGKPSTTSKIGNGNRKSW